jgi:ribonuclease BN (tRNA processing enzyme)
MKLRILGTGTSVPSLERLSSSCLLIVGNRRILVDVGPSVVRRLLECGHTVNDVDVIVVTHFHVDHTADLSTFLFACNYGTEPRRKGLLIIGGQGMQRFYRDLAAVYPWIRPQSYELTVKSLPHGRIGLDDFIIETGRMSHNRESIGVRIERAGKAVVYSGDTDYCRSLTRLARGADLLVVECSFPERKMKGHLNLALLNVVLARACPKRVILSHLDMEWAAFKGVLHAPCLLGVDGMTMEI